MGSVFFGWIPREQRSARIPNHLSLNAVMKMRMVTEENISGTGILLLEENLPRRVFCIIDVPDDLIYAEVD